MALAHRAASLSKDGVIFLEDSEIGSRIYEFSQKRLALGTEAGLDLCQKSTLEDKRIRDIVEFVFKRSKLALLKVFGPRDDIVFTFLTNPFNEMNETTDEVNKGRDKLKALFVLLLPRKSTMVFYKRSHVHVLRVELAKIGLLQVLPESLERQDIEPCEVTMKDGGFAVIDGRTAFKIVNGHINVVGFAIEEELRYWGKMQLPNKTGVIQKVQDMESEKIGMNVEFLENRYTGGSITSTT